ncbi:hypothetical protein MBLNU230_g2945t1 [Neophaeotheca triangularis]
MYYRGLKDNVKDELMRHGGDQSTLPGMIKSAIEVDNALYERPLRLSMPLEIPGSQEDMTVMDSEDDSEYEYTDDEEPDDNDTLEFIVEGPAPIKKMVTHIARSYEEVFLRIQGKRRLEPNQFEAMLMQLRAMF